MIEKFRMITKEFWNLLELILTCLGRVLLNEFPSERSDVTKVNSGLIPKHDAKAGKWVIICCKVQDDEIFKLTELDRIWGYIKMQVFFRRITGASCSTSITSTDSSSSGENSKYGVIKCYTSDFTKVSEVINCANIIRGVIKSDKKVLYYKTNVEKTGSKSYADVALYIFDANGELYVRNEFGKWLKLASGETLNSVIPRRMSRIFRPSIFFTRGVKLKMLYLFMLVATWGIFLKACFDVYKSYVRFINYGTMVGPA